ncbi:MAG: hypothetical protein ACREUG_16390 [Steroidobacteraceae bacterium]
MRQSVAHWMTDGPDQLRVASAIATAAFVSGGLASALALMLAWLVQHQWRHGARS